MSDNYQPWVKRCDFAAVKRSILRYLSRYEREWGYAPVWIYTWELSGAAPPEEDGAVMTAGRVRSALGALVREGKLQRRTHAGRNLYALQTLSPESEEEG